MSVVKHEIRSRGAAVVLGIDPGKSSGATILRPNGSIVKSGQFKEREVDLRMMMVKYAVGESLTLGVDLVVVHETWTAGGMRANPKTFIGLGAQLGRWLECVDYVAEYLPQSRVMKCTPQRWITTSAWHCSRTNIRRKR